MEINVTNISHLPNFTANAQQYRNAKRYLRQERINIRRSAIRQQIILIRNGIKNHDSFKQIISKLDLNISHFNFSHSKKATRLKSDGIKIFDADKLEGLQYNIDVFKDLSMREIIFLAYRTTNLAVKRGCAKMCRHCFLDAKPADKSELSAMPFEDFKKITDGFNTINKRLNKFLRNKPKAKLIGYRGDAFLTGNKREMVACFWDSDGIETVSVDNNGQEHDLITLIDMIYSSTGKKSIFDTEGWNPNNEKLQQRAEKYAEYFNTFDAYSKIEQINLSVNTFNPLYLKSYEFGYRAGKENDLTNPKIQKGKILYDRYIEKIANMIVTLGLSTNVSLLLRYSTKSEPNMDGMYFKDLEQILHDAQKKCTEILKNKYPEQDAIQKSNKIKYMIRQAIETDGGSRRNSPLCIYTGRYQELYNLRNPQNPKKDTHYTAPVQDINELSPVNYERFLNNNNAIVDSDGCIYYSQHDASIRALGKKLIISTNGTKTPKITNLESD